MGKVLKFGLEVIMFQGGQMHNRKGVIGFSIVSFVSLIATIFIIGIFLFLSFTLSKTKGIDLGDSECLSCGFDNPDLLFKSIDVDGKGEVLVGEFLMMYHRGGISNFMVESQLKKLVDKYNSCLILGHDSKSFQGIWDGALTGSQYKYLQDDFFLEFSKDYVRVGSYSEFRAKFSEYDKKGLLKKGIFFGRDGEKIYTMSYYGGCLND
ncbi:hypothetical protein COU54_04560 [Candidatus Pacearchaeota archaeon CG10_big_fil_rev_8_21_14_0_10_31_24]|nr:MAG: hypothetical protein COU54_04560 [Candidatus Pacearchaeota archaeon CG10_big_fil_rev_8_21_14_0_10_31_24]